jgi:hypothetical protein
MANTQHFIRHLQHLSVPIMAVSAFNGSPELASLLSLRAAIVFVLKTSRLYSRLVPAIAAEMEKERELERERKQQQQQQQKDFLGRLRRPLQTRTAISRQRRGDGVGYREEWHGSWTLRQYGGLYASGLV